MLGLLGQVLGALADGLDPWRRTVPLRVLGEDRGHGRSGHTQEAGLLAAPSRAGRREPSGSAAARGRPG